MTYNLYVDESCHFEKDNSSVMCIGYIKIPRSVSISLKEQIKSIKNAHRTPFEIKWNKFSSSRLQLYKDIVDFFFDNPIEFRCILIKYKNSLNHAEFNQGSHENFYYKMTYLLLRPNPSGVKYHVYLDILNTRGRDRLKKIKEVFNNYHNGISPFESFQHLNSENTFFQLTDLFVGAVTYKARLTNNDFKSANPNKMEFIQYLESKCGFLLEKGTTSAGEKFNVFDHKSK